MKSENFSSKWGAILASAGSAIGLGNIWRFPYLVGEYGGFGFIFLYMLILVFICNPIMITEISLGRAGRSSVIDVYKIVGEKAGLKSFKLWQFFGGWSGIIGLIMIISFYFLVAGWVIYYLFCALEGDILTLSKEELSQNFSALTQNFSFQYVCSLAFLFLTALIIAAGVKSGIEKVSVYTMPILFLLFIALAIQTIMMDGAQKGLAFMFTPDWQALGFTENGFDAQRFGKVFTAALGQAFISLSLGYGMLMVYGSYVSIKENVFSMVKSIEVFDTMAALLSAVIVIPAIFAAGGTPTSGPGLTFISLPLVFQEVAGGRLWAVMFYLLLLLATLTSVISVFEGLANLFIKSYNFKRITAVSLVVAMAMTGLTLVTISFTGKFPLTLFGQDLFTLFDHISTAYTSSIMAISMSLFVGYGTYKIIFRNLGHGVRVNSPFAKYYLFSLRYLIPLFIGTLLITSIYNEFN